MAHSSVEDLSLLQTSLGSPFTGQLQIHLHSQAARFDVSDLVASVVVPHYNDLLSLDRCLVALETQDYPREKFEIIVADNMSPCGIERVREILAGRAQLVEVEEAGAGPARNGGAALARGKHLAFTDSDCIPDPGWLRAGLQKLEQGDIVGGRMTVLVETTGPLTMAEAFEKVFAFDNETYVTRKHFSVTANLFVRRVDFERVGGFRVGVSEDQEWCLRARALGLQLIYAPDAMVSHPARHSWDDLIKKWRRLVLEQYKITREWRFGYARWLIKTWAIIPSIIVHLPVALTSDQLVHWRDRRAAARGLIRLRLWRFIEAHRVMVRD